MVHIYVGLFPLAFHKKKDFIMSHSVKAALILTSRFSRMSFKWVVITSTSLFTKPILSLLSCDGLAVKSAVLELSQLHVWCQHSMNFNAHIYFIFFVRNTLIEKVEKPFKYHNIVICAYIHTYTRSLFPFNLFMRNHR